MKLTIEDKKTLHDIGMPDSDFQQIERAIVGKLAEKKQSNCWEEKTI